jgi:hypothetical protein
MYSVHPCAQILKDDEPFQCLHTYQVKLPNDIDAGIIKEWIIFRYDGGEIDLGESDNVERYNKYKDWDYFDHCSMF